ncbi:MAG: GAF domain-containing sensor histidine kinase [Elusimicrobiales bacterium]|nr:GAF domain-containing sensor histidine kinase [Elusimicrobiales bacterium]
MIVQTQESLEMLVMVSRLLSSKLDISELLTTIMRLASRVVGAERASLYLLDEKTQELYFDVALGLPQDVAKIRLKLGEGVAGTCAKEGRSIIANDVAGDNRHSGKVDAKSGFVTRSLLTCPMIIKGKVIGVVQAINKTDGDFTETDRNNFEAFSSQAAIAIENSRLFSSVKEEKGKLEIVFRKIREGAILTDPGGKILIANNAARLFLEFEKFKFADMREAFRTFCSEEAYDSVMASTERTAKFDFAREKPKRLYLEGSAIRLLNTPKEGEEPETEGWLWILSDVTAQRLEERMARNFLSLISHKFKTPLAAISGYAQILSDESHSSEMPEIVRKSAGTIYKQGARLTSLVESLLDFVTVDSLEQSSLSCSSFDAGELAKEVAETARKRLDMTGVACRIAIPEPVSVRGDRGLIKSALKNLVENAVKFNPAKEKLVVISAAAKDAKVMLSVGDNGPGIPGEEHENIFGKFYQVEASFTGQVEGWGIGLALVRKVAEVHGGRALVKSQLQKGSAFTMILPQ